MGHGGHGYMRERWDMAILRKWGHGYTEGKEEHCYIEGKVGHGYREGQLGHGYTEERGTRLYG